MKPIIVGSGVALDVGTLLRTRLLVQANSGGGKSWLLRRLLEQSHGQVQQIVIDVEGEFATLREKFDYVLVGKGGEIHADPRYAKDIALKLLELGVSAIVDLYELSAGDRLRFARGFLSALVNAPKELWHPTLVVIDEAHKFCPEGKENESTAAVIDLATRGRKRAFAVILATQRISKLHKDAAAECLNKLIGRCTLDIDRKRAADEIGFYEKDQILSLRDLEEGEFYVYGPAITKIVTKVKVGAVQTTHPDIGHKAPPVPPPREAVKRVLAQLASLPKEVETKAATEADLRRQIHDLEAQIKRGKSIGRELPPELVEAVREKGRAEGRAEYREEVRQVKQAVAKIYEGVGKQAKAADRVHVELSDLLAFIDPVKIFPAVAPALMAEAQALRAQRPPVTRDQRLAGIKVSANHPPLKSGARRLLAALVQWSPGGMTEAQMRSHAGLRKSGTYTAYKSALRAAGYMEERGNLWYATEAGISEVGEHAEVAPRTTEEVLAIWRPKLKSGARRMLDVLVSYGGEWVWDEQLQREAELVKSGTYTAYKSALRNARLIETDKNRVCANRETLMLGGRRKEVVL